ncbi:MAG: type II secretory pathway predicted ATPase ExeA [Gammaproteobacteria bacterium]|jgi:type II secretory pathway predicted ATPase ExeA
MYYDYFGLDQPPFRITPDTNLFYAGGNRGAILDALVYAIQNGEGIVKVVGEVGSGKTMLCRMLEKELPDNIEVVYMMNPSISPENTLHAIAFELKLDVKPDTSRFEVMNVLQQYLLQKHSENRQVVVFVEEAQSMPIATLEEIRLLTNLETQQSKLLQIVLFGQPELDVMISQPEIRQLKERITYSFDLTPFKTNDIREYLNTRIRACGYRAGDLFDDSAIKQIESYSEGLLRRINILADKSLLAAYADNARQVNIKHTRLAARDSEFIPSTSRVKLPIVITAATLVAVLAVSSYFIFRQSTNGQVQQINTSGANSSDETIHQIDILPPVPVKNSTVIEERITQQIPDSINNEVSNVVTQAVSSTTVSTTETAINPDMYKADVDVIAVNPDTNSVQHKTLQVPNLIGISKEHDVEDQLLGMTVVFRLQDRGDSRLTVSETAALQRQLDILPPESVDLQKTSPESDICDRCWSFIYRPIWTTENL